MNQVESKYKDPDKFIQRLKAEIQREREWAKEDCENYIKERGSHWFNFTDGVFKTASLDVETAAQSRIGQTVRMSCKIIGYERDGKRYDVKMEIKELRLIDK